MTLIECFTESHIDNISACLRLRPDKLIMVGDELEMSEPVSRYKDLLRQRKQRTVVTMRDVSGKDFADICRALNGLVRAEDECVIDLTGGDEAVIMAVGAVVAGLDSAARQRLRVEKFDHDSGQVRDCINDNRVIPYKPIRLTVEEIITLHGGSVQFEEYQPADRCRPRDLEDFWKMVSKDTKQWNQAINPLNEFESRADSKSQVFLWMENLRDEISDFDRKEKLVRELLEKMYDCGAIDYQSNRFALEYTYKSAMHSYCTLKAGNILELKTLLEGRSVLENGAPYFHDSKMGISIDWDDDAKKKQETRNEIDVILMHGTTPLFISCKNGDVDEDELYKLHTVAERFGGPYARKMLIATDLERKGIKSVLAFTNRAQEMGIYPVTDAADLTEDKWNESFVKAMN